MPEIKNLKEAAERILKAIQNQENIIIYGDADLDGVSSVIVLREAIRNLAGKVSAVYFPDRESEGYGISETGLDFLKNYSPALLITVDCGIANFKEVKLAKKLGFEIIIIDHHQVLDKLPEAKIIIDPKQKGDNYPFKDFSAAGLVFKLSEALLIKRMTLNLRKNFLELAALATIADMMPRVKENKIFIEEGLRFLEKSFRPGLRAFFETEAINNYQNLEQKVSKIISILNIRDVKNRLPASFRLLTTPDLEGAKGIVEELLEKGKIRRETIEIINQEIEELQGEKSEPIIFEGDESFDSTLISSSASFLCQKYQKPTFIFKKMARESQGTVRTPSGVNGVDLMKKCSKYLLTYGGHPQASGFRIKNENLGKFKECLIKNRVFAGQKRR